MENNQENSPDSLQSACKDVQFTDKSALKFLYELMLAENRKRYPNNPYPLTPKRFNLRNSADLTKAIIKWIQLHGFQANHLNPKVRLIDNSCTATDVMGLKLRHGSEYRALTHGSPIISATIHGQSVKLEIRSNSSNYGQYELQKQYRHQVEQSGVLYFIVTSFGQFADWFYTLIGSRHE